MVNKNKFDINKKLLFIKKKSRKLLLTFIVFIVILSIFFYLNFTNYFPYLSETKQPSGSVESINIQKYIQENPEIKEMPNLDKINYDAWRSNLTIKELVYSYKQDLLKNGYNLRYEDTINFDEKEYYVLGFLKGITAVGILLSLDKTYEDKYNSEVIYATGNVFDFNEIIDWYQSQYQ